MVEPALQAHLDARVPPGADPVGLLLAQGQAGGLAGAGVYQAAQGGPPAAADVEDAVGAAGPGPVDVVVNLAELGGLQLVVAVVLVPEGAGVTEGGVEPEAIEVVAD